MYFLVGRYMSMTGTFLLKPQLCCHFGGFKFVGYSRFLSLIQLIWM